MINTQRMLNVFFEMIQIPSLPGKERKMCDFLKCRLEALEGSVYEDSAGKAFGGECGNLIVSFPTAYHHGKNLGKNNLVLNAHMDTVMPGEGIIPIKADNDTITSAGDTILGADDKAGIAIILEILNSLHERNIARDHIEILFTVSEETGLLGAKNLEREKIKGKYCIAFDSGKSNELVNRAPAANRITFNIYGKDAHAGVCPERGVSAIKIAADAVHNMPLGRLDEESTANIGVFHSGDATNIVPKHAVLRGEARSHNLSKLEKQTNKMVECVKNAIERYSRGEKEIRFESDITLDFPILFTPENSPLVITIKKMAAEKNTEMILRAGGGGSDANIFQSYGMETVVMGTGMDDVHTTSEKLYISHMVKTAEIVLSLVENWKKEIKNF